MPVFDYKGLDRQGRNVRGSVDADNLRAARARLKKDGVYVIDLKDKTKAASQAASKRGHGNKKVGVEDLSTMTRQFASLIKANVPLVDALAAIADQVENPILKDAISDLKNQVNEGSTLHKAMAKYPKIFDKIYVSMCEAGEMSGSLDVILMRLAEFTEAQSELTSKVKSAMIYPVVMFVATIGILSFMFIFVIPKIITVFESMPELTLPWYTQAVIGFSGLLVNYWHIIIISGFALTFIFRSWKNSPSGSEQWDSIVLRLPVVGKVARMVAVSRFTRTLSTLLTGGVPMLGAMEIVRNVVNNHVLAEAIEQARNNISEGESIAGPLKKSGQFPPLVIHMINIGEKTGELENMLAQVSDSYDFQVKNSITALTSLLEPAMIIIMGGVIGGIVVSIMVPIFEMTNLGG